MALAQQWKIVQSVFHSNLLPLRQLHSHLAPSVQQHAANHHMHALAGLRPLADRINQERQHINSSAESIFMPLRQIWEVGMTALMHRADQWESKAHLAVRALAALKELLLLLPTWDSIKADITRFWGEAHAVSEGLFNTFLAGEPPVIHLLDTRSPDTMRIARAVILGRGSSEIGSF